MSLSDSGVLNLYRMMQDADERAHEARQAAQEASIRAYEAKSAAKGVLRIQKVMVLAMSLNFVCVLALAGIVLLSGCTYVTVTTEDVAVSLCSPNNKSKTNAGPLNRS